MGDAAYDREHALVTVACAQMATDTLHVMFDSSDSVWLAMNTKYSNTRITVCPTRENMEAVYAALGKALGKTGAKTMPLLEACDAADVNATDLCDELTRPSSAALKVEPYRLIDIDEDGYRTITGWMLWFPEISRAGIARDADASWTDADSPEDALRRYCEDDMSP